MQHSVGSCTTLQSKSTPKNGKRLPFSPDGFHPPAHDMELVERGARTLRSRTGWPRERGYAPCSAPSTRLDATGRARRNPRSRQSGMLTRRVRGPLHHGEALQRGDNAPMIWHLAASANRSRPALHQPSTAAARKASSASPMMTPHAQMRTASKERIMAMQMDETELEDMRDDALALAKGVLNLLEAAQAAAGTGVQLGEEGLGALVSEQERVVSAIAGIARPRG